MTRYVIIGGDAAGMSAATQIRRLNRTAEIIVFEKGKTISYAQCGLPYFIAGLVPTAKDLVARTPEQFREKYQIDIFVEHEVIKLEATAKQVVVQDLVNKVEKIFSFDYALIATGGEAIIPNWPGVKLNGVFPLKDLEDAKKINNWLSTEQVEKVVIIGGGYIGLEMAEAMHILQKKEITVIDLAPQLANTFDPDMAVLAKEELEKQGIKVFLEEEVVELLGEEGRVKAVKTKNNEYSADLVLVAIGITPNNILAKQAGIELGYKNAIKVNSRMETSIPYIYAAGDCATQFHRIKETDDYIPLGTTANKQGRIAGTNMGGEKQEFQGVVGTAIMKVLNLQMGRTGLSEKEAKAFNIPYETVTIRSKNHAHYYPNGKKLHLKLVYHKENKQLLGAQIVGEEGVDKRIDVLATALYQKMRIDDLENIDLAYAPPFNSVWDPIQQAAKVAEKNE